MQTLEGQPLVSIVIPNYNYAHFLPEAIDSALGQTYPHVEVIVVDDGSTDDSLAVLASYGDKVRVLTQVNAGAAAAIRAGLDAASGEVLVALDADDSLGPDTIARVVAALDAHPEPVRVQYRLAVVDRHGQPTGEQLPPRNRPLLSGDLEPRFRRYRNIFSPPETGNAYRISAIRRLPPVPDGLAPYTDFWFTRLLTLIGPVASLDGIGGTYRVHGANESQRVPPGLEYFDDRVQRMERLHQAATDLALELGKPPMPDLYAPQDALFFTGRLVADKLGSARPSGKRTWWLGLRTVRAILADRPLHPRDRLLRSLWVIILCGLPKRGNLVRSLVARRFGAAA